MIQFTLPHPYIDHPHEGFPLNLHSVSRSMALFDNSRGLPDSDGELPGQTHCVVGWDRRKIEVDVQAGFSDNWRVHCRLNSLDYATLYKAQISGHTDLVVDFETKLNEGLAANDILHYYAHYYTYAVGVYSGMFHRNAYLSRQKDLHSDDLDACTSTHWVYCTR